MTAYSTYILKKSAHSVHWDFLTGLPDNYARGRIIGDYRRLALYGIDRLIEAKMEDLHNLTGPMTDDRIRLREEVAEQIKALKDIKIMGEYYGLDLSRPATSAQEAVQWVYMAYLAAVKNKTVQLCLWVTFLRSSTSLLNMTWHTVKSMKHLPRS